MHRLRSLWLAAPVFLGACSFLNAPADLVEGTSSGGAAGGTGGTGGTAGAGGTGGAMTTSTTDADVCGDGAVTGTEACDDGGTKAGDGCSATCAVEPGFSCMGAPSTCAPLCGNGALDPGEECDDGGAQDVTPPPGDQDYCTDKCAFKEFDVEVGADINTVNERPVAGYRDEGGTSVFSVLWHASRHHSLLARQYRFDGSTFTKAICADNGAACTSNGECCSQQCTSNSCSGPVTCTQLLAVCQKDLDCCSQQCVGGLCSDAPAISTSTDPDVAGERICTGLENKRSLVFWHDKPDATFYARKIDSDGTLIDPLPVAVPPTPTPSLACAAASTGAFVGVTMVKSGALWDVYAQPYTTFAAPNGNPIDIGDATNDGGVSAWSLDMGFLVAWVADPLTKGPLRAQQLDKDGKPQVGFIYDMSDMADAAPAEPWGERIGTQDQFAFAYTRDSAPDGGGNTHREAVVRIFKSVGAPSKPIVLSMDTNPQSEPRVAANPTNGKFVVVWTGGPPGGENILMRAFDPAGADVSPEKIVHDNQLGQQTSASVAVDPKTGNVAVVWDNFVPNSGKPRKVSARIFAGLLK